MPSAPTTADVERLRSSAARARHRADAARALASDIDRRRVLVLRRDDECRARHTPDVWSSSAAARSREELRAEVGFSLWATSESLSDTRRALERHAQELDASAASYRRQANAAYEMWLEALAEQ